MQKRYWMLLGIVLASVSLASCRREAARIPPTAIKDLCVENQCFEIEIAQTPEERVRGLQNRTSLPEGRGMLFIFTESGKHSFWMKDTLISLDLIWIDAQKRIAAIVPNVLPCETEHCPVYAPDRDALYVLEINAGLTAEKGIKVGDQVIF